MSKRIDTTSAELTTFYKYDVLNHNLYIGMEETDAVEMLFATTKEPPKEKEHFVRCFSEEKDKWEYLADYRGEIYYDVDKNEHKVEDLGIEPDTAWMQEKWTDEREVWNGKAWELPFEAMREDKIAWIKTERKRRAAAGFTLNGMFIATDDVSLQRISDAVSAAEKHPAHVFDWQVNETTFVRLGKAEINAIGDAAFYHIQGCFSVQKQLLQEAQAAKTPAELDAITWPE